MKDFDERVKQLFCEIGQCMKMVLSTSYNDCPTSRMMSIIVFNEKFYFQTDKNFRKYEQLQKNRKVALCIDNLSVEGICLELGHPTNDEVFSELYMKCFPSAYEKYTGLSNERLFEISPKYIKKWIYEDGKPYEEIFDFTVKVYEKKEYDCN